MINSDQVKENMEVVGSDGKHVGKVDRCEGDRIKLMKNDPAAQGQHHMLDVSDIERVEGNRLILGVTADDAKRRWQPA